MHLRRPIVDFLPPDVGKDALPVTRVILDQLFHRDWAVPRPSQLLGPGAGHRVGNSLFVRVIKSKARAEDVTADKALARVGVKTIGIVVAAAGEEKSRD